MKKNILTIILMMGILSSCTTSLFLTSNTPNVDDIYYNPEKKYVAYVNEEDINPLNSKDERIAELQRKMNAKMIDTVVTTDTVYIEEVNTNPYESILVNSVSESKTRRLKAQSELSFNYNTYIDALFYASAYDPAFYNVVIYGSHVWVEPRWVSSSWYIPHSYYSMGFYYGIYNFRGVDLHQGYYLGYNDYYEFNGYYYGRPANSNNYHFGRRVVSSSEYYKNEQGINRYDNNYVETRRRGTSEPIITNTTTTSNPNGDLDGSTLRRHHNGNPSEPKNMNQPNSRQRTGTTTVYTRPSTVNQKGEDVYIPTYTRPSGGVRQDYNSSRPESSGNYERKTNDNTGTSENSYHLPSSNSNHTQHTSTDNSNSGGTRRR